MIDFLKKLAARGAEVNKKFTTDWQQLVAKVEGGVKLDPDQVIADLQRLGRSVEDLATAAELLGRRRQWAATVAAEPAAESRLEEVGRRIGLEEQKFKGLVEAHEAAMGVLSDQRQAAADAISGAADARRDLLRTATCQGVREGCATAERELADMLAERSLLTKNLDEKRVNLRHLNQDDQSLKGHRERMHGDIEAMAETAKELDAKIEGASRAADAARAKLLDPAAI